VNVLSFRISDKLLTMRTIKILSVLPILLLANLAFAQEDCAKMPVEKGTIGSLYGYRIHPKTNTKKFHAGIDIRAKHGNSVYAAFDGKVVEVKKSSKGYENGLVTLYAHLSAFSVKKGDVICKGKIIGEIGTSGNATGPHLHFEIIENKKKINPLKYLL
jgi:murein DD-endopeptidase MepM/ murein hydrolase activator NlpD